MEWGLPSIPEHMCPAGSELSVPNINFLPRVANPGTGGSGLSWSEAGGCGEAGLGLSGSGDCDTPLLCKRGVMDSSEMGEEGWCVVCITVSVCTCVWGIGTISPLGGTVAAVGEQFVGCVDSDGGFWGTGCSGVVGICGVGGGE